MFPPDHNQMREPVDVDWLIEGGEARTIAHALSPVLREGPTYAVLPERRVQHVLMELHQTGSINESEWQLLGELAQPGATYGSVAEVIGQSTRIVSERYADIIDTVRFGLLAASKEPDPDDWPVPEFAPVTES